ncbi:MAG: FlxA-like family protein, partial [Eubacterium sp.]|nr:FlxA-like family protein [Eubacterium sp.]
MTINGISGANTQAGQFGMNQATDSYSKNIQNQIANAQKQLQELSSNEDMTLEEKMKKRQEIQQQISDLNMQLRKHQAEQRKEKQQAKGSSMDDMAGGASKKKTAGKSAGISQAGMTAIISADSSMKQAKVQGSVAKKMEGRAGV